MKLFLIALIVSIILVGGAFFGVRSYINANATVNYKIAATRQLQELQIRAERILDANQTDKGRVLNVAAAAAELHLLISKMKPTFDALLWHYHVLDALAFCRNLSESDYNKEDLDSCVEGIRSLTRGG